VDRFGFPNDSSVIELASWWLRYLFVLLATLLRDMLDAGAVCSMQEP